MLTKLIVGFYLILVVSSRTLLKSAREQRDARDDKVRVPSFRLTSRSSFSSITRAPPGCFIANSNSACRLVSSDASSTVFNGVKLRY
jgi:hypothetical protein